MIAVILPTRGFVFSEVEDSIEKLRLQHGLCVYRSWDLPIPDAQNFLVKEALKNKEIEYLFFVEEDTVPPKDAIKKLLQVHADIACIDYGVQGWGCVTKDKRTEEILWCGLGCTLVKREIFDKVDKPWFRTDKQLRLNDWMWIDVPSKYGTLDIWFFTKAREKGYRIKQIEGECKHLQLMTLGAREHNNGLHIIQRKSSITKHQTVDVL